MESYKNKNVLHTRQSRKVVLIFHHNDLDGVGVLLSGVAYARLKGLRWRSYSCSYANINETVMKVLSTTSIKDIDKILIGDIVVSNFVAEELNKLYKSGVDIVLQDHHASSYWINKYEWAQSFETDDGTPRCGSWRILHKGLKISDPTVFRNLEKVMLQIDEWDCWKWVTTGNELPKKLHELYKVVGEQEFSRRIIEKVFSEYRINLETLFTKDIEAVIRNRRRSLEASAGKQLSKMTKVVFKIKNYRNPKKSKKVKVGVVYSSFDVADFALEALSKVEGVDILLILNLPFGFSLRRVTNTEFPLDYIAKCLTGDGGGSQRASGSTLNKKQREKLTRNLLRLHCSDSIKISKEKR